MGLVLSGCTGDPEQPGALPGVASPTPSPTQASSRPQPPAVAAAATSAGAAAFAEYFLTSIDAALATADPTPISDLSLAGCGGCAALARAVAGLAAAGQRQQGGNYASVRAVAPGIRNGDVVVDITYMRGAGRIVSTDGTTVRLTPPVGQTLAQVRLLRRGRTWRVQGFRVVPS